MLLLLVAFLFAEHSHHFCSAFGHPDSACTKGVAASDSFHWPEADDQYATPAESRSTVEPVETEFRVFTAFHEVLGSIPAEAPQHVPIHA